MFQEIIVGLIFLTAVAYVVRMIVRSLRSKSACESGCGKCGAIDLAKIEQQLKQRGL